MLSAMFKSWFGNKRQMKDVKLSPRVQDALNKYQESFCISKNQRVTETEFVAVDFETTGLNAKNDRIISMGFVSLTHASVALGSSEYLIVNPQTSLSEANVVIHQMTDSQVEAGASAEDALCLFLTQTQGKVVIAHHHLIERRFILQFCLRHFGQKIPLAFVDTLLFENKRMQRRDKQPASGDLRLSQLRQSYHLPPYPPHHALEDAIATAELFLAQLASMNMELETIRLKDIGCRFYPG